MRLTGQLILIMTICVIVVLAVLSVGRWSAGRISAYQEAQNSGVALLLQSKRVYTDLQYLMLEVIAPEGQSVVADVLQRPPANIQLFEASISDFSQAYDAFFENAQIRALLTDRMLERHYGITRSLGEKAFADLERIRSTLLEMETEHGVTLEHRYRQIIVIDDQDETSLLADVRYVSHFFSETFERFLELFIFRLNRNAEMLQQQALRVSQLTTAVGLLLALSLAFAFAARLTRRLQHFMHGVEALSKGEFGMSVPEGPGDEIGVLLRRFNHVSGELARNIDSISGLMNAVGQQISSSPEFPHVREIIGEATLHYTDADCVCLSSEDDNGKTIPYVFRSKDPAVTEADVSCWQRFPLHTRVDPNLLLAVGTVRDHLSELDISHVRTLSKYVALLIDHNDVYRELAERRQVAYEALQAQIQPHFLFNVLGGVFGLNRKGDRNGVERSIVCLRDMLHYIIDGSENSLLAEEIGFNQKYLELQQIRFAGRIEANVSCDPRIADLVVPKLLLQPIVENAVVHGIEKQSSGRSVQLAARPVNGGCRITVADNGCGFDVDRYHARAPDDPPPGECSGSHIGIANVQRRLALRFPSGRFRIESAVGAGTTVTIDIPCD